MKTPRTLHPLMAAALLVAASGSSQGATLFYDFSTDPNISSEWTSFGYFGTPPATATVVTWNSMDQTLDFAKTTGGTGGWVLGLYPTLALRGPNEPVTMTVLDMNRTAGTWGQVGLMIDPSSSNPSLVGSQPRYEWMVRYDSSGPNAGYNLRVRKDVGTGSFELFNENLGATFTDPITLDIVRAGDNYEFLADGVSKYIASTYSAAVHDSFTNYQITFGGDMTGTASITNFGTPEPSTALLIGMGFISLLRRRRR